MEKRIVFSFEIPVRQRLYEERPLLVIQDFLDCIDDGGVQTVELPPHVVKAMAERFRRVIGPEHTLNSLDTAFGGRVARQRNAMAEEEKTGEIVFEHIVARKAAKKVPRSERTGTPSEIASEAVARQVGVSEESIKRRYKNAARR